MSNSAMYDFSKYQSDIWNLSRQPENWLRNYDRKLINLKSILSILHDQLCDSNLRSAGYRYSNEMTFISELPQLLCANYKRTNDAYTMVSREYIGLYIEYIPISPITKLIHKSWAMNPLILKSIRIQPSLQRRWRELGL